MVDERYSCVGMRFHDPVLVRFVRFSCVRHPVGILYVSVDVRSTSVVNGQPRDR